MRIFIQLLLKSISTKAVVAALLFTLLASKSFALVNPDQGRVVCVSGKWGDSEISAVAIYSDIYTDVINFNINNYGNYSFIEFTYILSESTYKAVETWNVPAGPYAFVPRLIKFNNFKNARLKVSKKFNSPRFEESKEYRILKVAVDSSDRESYRLKVYTEIGNFLFVADHLMSLDLVALENSDGTKMHEYPKRCFDSVSMPLSFENLE